MTKITSAMIFAAGFGTRMGVLSSHTPKPLIPIAGRPMIDYAIDLLRDAGISSIVANAHYMSDQITAHLMNRNVTVSMEDDKILDTGGGLKFALPSLGDGPVITINPDAIWLGPNPISELLSAWDPSMSALLMLAPKERAHGTNNSGDFSLEQGTIVRNGSYIYGGAQILRTHDLHKMSADVFSLNAYWDHLAKSGDLNGVAYSGDWCDIGTPEGLRTAEALVSDV